MSNVTQLHPSTGADYDWCYFPRCPTHMSPTGPPKRIMPTNGELLEHSDAQARYNCINKPRINTQTEADILDLILTSETEHQFYNAYRIAEHAGLCWWSNKEREWQWIDKH